MKRQILSLATAMALTAGGAVFAQSTLNTPAPGPSQETKPGQTNNNLQNPGSNMQKPATPPVRENGSPEGTAAAAGFAMFMMLGLVFDWWEQPPFGVFLGVLAGLALTARDGSGRDEPAPR